MTVMKSFGSAPMCAQASKTAFSLHRPCEGLAAEHAHFCQNRAIKLWSDRDDCTVSKGCIQYTYSVTQVKDSCQYFKNPLFLIANVSHFKKTHLNIKLNLHAASRDTVTSEEMHLPETSKLSYFLSLEVMFTILHLCLFNTFHELSAGIFFSVWQSCASISPLPPCISLAMQKNFAVQPQRKWRLIFSKLTQPIVLNWSAHA